MSKRRGSGEGTIFQRSDGRWVAGVNVGWRNGRRQRLFRYSDTQADAIRALANLREERKQGCLPADVSFEQYANRWLALIEKEVRPRTAAYYRQHLRLYVLPVLSKHILSNIRPRDIRALLTGLRERGYAKNTVRLARAVVSAMFPDAVQDELVNTNPALAVRTGRRRAGGMTAEDRTRAIRPLDENALIRFLESARTDSAYYPLFLLLAHSGMRPSEAYALKWNDIDFERREILVERALSAGLVGTTKTGRPRRVDMSPELCEALGQLHGLRERERLLSGWSEFPEWVFVNTRGRALDESLVRYRFAQAMRRVGLSGHRLYDLRHTYATLLLSRGVPVTYVADQLGHAKPTTTLQWYAHWLPRPDKIYVENLPTARNTTILEAMAVNTAVVPMGRSGSAKRNPLKKMVNRVGLEPTTR